MKTANSGVFLKEIASFQNDAPTPLPLDPLSPPPPQFHVWIGEVPEDADAAASTTNAIALAEAYDLDGFSLDDEHDCAPRSTLDRFQTWVSFVNAWSDGLHGAQRPLQVSAAVQVSSLWWVIRI